MEAQNENVKEIAKRIGILNKKVISQAMEYLRLLKIKTNLKGTNNEYPRMVICLDISAAIRKEQFNLDKALQLTKYRKVKYRNEKNTILRFLDLAEAPNIKSICNALKLTRIKDVEKKATQILTKLKKNKANLLGEIGHPQNASMAVYCSCQLLAVKVDERKLIGVSRLQRKQWTQLKNLWRPFLDECMVVAYPNPMATKETSKNEALTRSRVTDRQTRPPANTLCVMKSQRREPRLRFGLRVVTEPIESYYVWKKRILAKAYADLALLKRKTSGRCKKTTQR